MSAPDAGARRIGLLLPVWAGILLGMTVLTLIFLRTGWKLTRREGLVLILVGALRWSLDFLPGLFG